MALLFILHLSLERLKISLLQSHCCSCYMYICGLVGVHNLFITHWWLKFMFSHILVCLIHSWFHKTWYGSQFMWCSYSSFFQGYPLGCQMYSGKWSVTDRSFLGCFFNTTSRDCNVVIQTIYWDLLWFHSTFSPSLLIHRGSAVCMEK